MVMDSARDFHILIVDDFEGHRITAKKFLQRLSFVKSISTARDSSEMIDVVMSNPKINMLIIDFDLGEDSLNGLQAYTLIKEAGYDIPAILVTGNDVDAFDSFNIGVVDVISKKFFYDFKRLNQAIRKLNNYFYVQELCDNDLIYVPVYDGKIRQLLPSQVIYMEPTSAKTAVYTTIQDDPFISEFSMVSYEQFLENSKIEKMSRFLLVNVDHVQAFDAQTATITMSNGVKHSISDSNKKYVSKLLASRKSGGSGLARMLLWGMRKKQRINEKGLMGS
ncbi:hypothetical protein J31TS6_57280 [Brevibacillus reuszeri]|nr:hypothetical protein J31TS6_57280 [Brevibacillus reuszeri]